MIKNTFLKTLILAASMSTITISMSYAEAKQPLESSMSAAIITTDKSGHESNQPATEVEPGQTVEYTLSYKNTGDKALSGIAVTGPIPKETAYLKASAKTKASADFQVSIDGGKTFESEPVKRMVTADNGKKMQQVIPPSEYTHVRWNLKQPLNVGDEEVFVYRSVVK